MTVIKKEIIENISEQSADKNKDLITTYLAEDVIWNIAGICRIYGRDNVINKMQKQEYEELPKVSVNNIIIDDEYVIIESTGTILLNGKKCNSAYCDIYHLVNGKIQEFTSYIVNSKNIVKLKNKGGGYG